MTLLVTNISQACKGHLPAHHSPVGCAGNAAAPLLHDAQGLCQGLEVLLGVVLQPHIPSPALGLRHSLSHRRCVQCRLQLRVKPAQTYTPLANQYGSGIAATPPRHPSNPGTVSRTASAFKLALVLVVSACARTSASSELCHPTLTCNHWL